MNYVTRHRIYMTAAGRLCVESDPDAHLLFAPAGAVMPSEVATAHEVASFEARLDAPAPAVEAPAETPDVETPAETPIAPAAPAAPAKKTGRKR